MHVSHLAPPTHPDAISTGHGCEFVRESYAGTITSGKPSLPFVPRLRVDMSGSRQSDTVEEACIRKLCSMLRCPPLTARQLISDALLCRSQLRVAVKGRLGTWWRTSPAWLAEVIVVNAAEQWRQSRDE